MSPRHLLVVDDDEAFCLLVDAMLTARGYGVVTLTDARRAMDLLRHGDFDVVLLDLVMPELGGLELLRRIRRRFNVLPVLVVTADGSAAATLEAMRRGATDFVTKPVDATHLDLRIRAACDLERARRLADTDGLTGLYNHRYLQQRLAQEVERAERYGRSLSLAMADIDDFKTYNDAFGHPRGDEVLIEVSRILQRVGRGTDVVARYGGDEFTLILPETAVTEAGVLAERARHCVEALDTGDGVAGSPPLTLSLGVASCAAASNTRESLIGAADAALYRAKQLGRNRVCIAEPAAAALQAGAGAQLQPRASGGLLLPWASPAIGSGAALAAFSDQFRGDRLKRLADA